MRDCVPLKTAEVLLGVPNTGISAIINAKGEITHKLPYEIQGVLKGKIAPNEKITFYTQIWRLYCPLVRIRGCFVFSNRNQRKIEKSIKIKYHNSLQRKFVLNDQKLNDFLMRSISMENDFLLLFSL